MQMVVLTIEYKYARNKYQNLINKLWKKIIKKYQHKVT